MTTQRWPTAWLMTDERLADRLWDALAAVADFGGGVMFRHHVTPADERLLLARRVAELAQRRGLTLGIARDAVLAREVGADLVHNPVGDQLELPSSRSVHGEAEALHAAASGAALVFVSPIYPTRSHPGAPALGAENATRLARIAGVPAYALGGMDARKWPKLQRLGFAGWAGVDAWLN
ncbi:thiamine phosphate synthase [Sphingomonas sp. BN140010]|uniref:Thiamine phosphate synthase n=1 Tax=Sphingomonas arvum TaxID=2992113 RepID=A0ABT3JF72_9SPHN|nr:thiamine phosphate synthase [Sphingomonas sp. BN140010]MCW3797721.1 thiamine phosphate synthase [Sphingomonas sp. BN140010]